MLPLNILHLNPDDNAVREVLQYIGLTICHCQLTETGNLEH